MIFFYRFYSGNYDLSDFNSNFTGAEIRPVPARVFPGYVSYPYRSYVMAIIEIRGYGYQYCFAVCGI